MRRTFARSVAFIVALLTCSATSLPQGLLANWGWAACMEAPTRACVLEEALAGALGAAPKSASQLRTIAEAQVAAGDIQAALRIIPMIRDPAQRVYVLQSIASAQARLGLRGEAGERFFQAHLVADTIAEPLSRAEMLLVIARAETEAGLTAKAADTFDATLKLAEGAQLQPSSKCVIFPSQEGRLESTLQALAEQQARTGDFSAALRTARRIKYSPERRVEALRMLAALQLAAGNRIDAGATLKEALDAAYAAQSPSHPWPASCPQMQFGPPNDFNVHVLCKVAVAQAKAGFADDAAATLKAALQLVPMIKDGALWKAETSRSFALSEIAEAQGEANSRELSEATFDRALEAASQVNEARHQIQALTRLGQAQHRSGRTHDALRSFDLALALAYSRKSAADRANGLLLVLEAEDEVRITRVDVSILDTALAETRSIDAPATRISTLVRLAKIQGSSDRHREAVALFAEAATTIEAIETKWTQATQLLLLLRGLPTRAPDPSWIAENASQILRLMQSTEQLRPDLLVLVANALPN